MKKYMTGLMGAIAFFAAFGAAASDQGSLWDAEQFGMSSGFYSKWGERHEGSILFGYEYVPKMLKYGIGLRAGMGAYFADQKALDRGCGFTVPLGLYLPVHIMESLAVYAGGGLDVHGVYGSNKDEDSIGKYYGSGVTENLFAGVRYNFAISSEQSVFVFGEFCQDFGEISVKQNTGSRDSAKVDMSGSRFLVGLGILFW